MGNTAEQQSAFAAFDFAASEAWRDYFNNLTIPPDRVNDPAVIRRYKQKWYRQCVDAVYHVEPLQPSAASSANAAASAARTNPASSATQRPSASRSSASAGSSSNSAANPTSGSGAATGGSRVGGAWSRADSLKTAMLVAHVWVVTMAALALFPFSPRYLVVRGFRWALLGGLATSALSILHTHGRPAAITLDALKTWLQVVLTGPHLLTLMHCAIFLPSPSPMSLAVLPLAGRSVLPVAAHLKEKCSGAAIYRRYLAQPCDWLAANVARVELLIANTEVLLGPLLLFSLLTPQRSLVQLFLYWQLLKMRFHAPASKWYHRQIWGQLGGVVEPRLMRYAPFLQPPLGYAKTWFNTMGR